VGDHIGARRGACDGGAGGHIRARRGAAARADVPARAGRTRRDERARESTTGGTGFGARRTRRETVTRDTRLHVRVGEARAELAQAEVLGELLAEDLDEDAAVASKRQAAGRRR
jgi:hypothetical protein